MLLLLTSSSFSSCCCFLFVGVVTLVPLYSNVWADVDAAVLSRILYPVLGTVLRLRRHHCHLLLVIVILSYVIIIVPTTNCCCCFYLCLVIILLLSISSLHNHSYSYSSLFATSATAVVVPLYWSSSKLCASFFFPTCILYMWFTQGKSVSDHFLYICYQIKNISWAFDWTVLFYKLIYKTKRSAMIGWISSESTPYYVKPPPIK